MIYVFISVILFSFVHPLSKAILDTNIPLSFFCIGFVAIRFLAQLPFVVLRPEVLKGSKKHFLLLLLFGLCGACLQYLEFKGIYEGLSPALVTVVMFSYPVWVVLISAIFKNKSNQVSGTEACLKVVIGLFGVFLVSGLDSISFQEIKLLFYPFAASVVIAFWIFLSNKLKKENMDSLGLSFSYDLISLIFLLMYMSKGLNKDHSQFLNWSNSNYLVGSLVLYSLLIGLLPNMLFYKGSKTVSPLTVAFMMSLEPVFSSLCTSVLWKESLGVSFLIGAFLVLAINLPGGLWIQLLSKLKVLLKFTPDSIQPAKS